MEIDRKRFLEISGLLGLSSFLPFPALSDSPQAPTKKIPKTGEEVPVIGMGTWISFNVGSNRELRKDRTEVLRAFFQAGGGVVDSSPMYGSSEEVLGYALKKLGYPESLISATKIWTSSTAEGREQVENSMRLWGLDTFDLFQIHNLVNWEGHLETLAEFKRQKKIRYIGVTTSHGRRHQELERVLASQPVDFVQLTYNLEDREVEKRLLPLAKEKKIAVIANRPFQGGNLIRRLKGKPLPKVAKALKIQSWPVFLLKYVVSHPTMTCAIPATTKVEHMKENMRARLGAFPDLSQRREMEKALQQI